MTEPAKKDIYWVKRPHDEFAKEFFTRTNLVNVQTSALVEQQLSARQHYYSALGGCGVGIDGGPTSSALTASGPEGSSTDLVINTFQSDVNSLTQLIVAPEIALNCQAANTDAKCLADAQRGSAILEYLFKERGWLAAGQRSVRAAILDGENFLFSYWEAAAGQQLAYDKETEQVSYSGDLKVYEVPSWDVGRDRSAQSFEQSDWLSVRLSVNRFDLIAQFPQYADEILAATPIFYSPQGFSVGTANTDRISCWYFFHRKTAALPTGLQAVLIDQDTVLSYEPLEACYENLPISRMPMDNIEGTPYAYSKAWDCLGSMDGTTEGTSALVSNMVSFAKQAVTAEADSDVNFDSLGTGPAVVYYKHGSTPPTALQLQESSPDTYNTLNRLRQASRETLGLNDMTAGVGPQGPWNASAMALMYSAAVSANSQPQRNYISLMRNLGRSVLAIFRAKASTPTKVSIIGIHGPQATQYEFDSSDFENVTDVHIEVESPLSQTVAGRLQLVEVYQKAGIVLLPEMIQQLIETGRIDSMTEGLRSELDFIQQENEDLLQGIQVPALVADSHQLHVRAHKATLNSREVRRDAKKLAAIQAHIQEHLTLEMSTDPRILQILGQAAPPPGAPAEVDPTKAAIGPQGALSNPLAHQTQVAASIEKAKAPNNPATGQPFPGAGVGPARAA